MIRGLRVLKGLAGATAAAFALSSCASGQAGEREGAAASVEETASEAESGADTSEDLGTLDPGRLQVGLTLAYAPYSYVTDQGDPAGFDVEALQMVADELGVDLELTDIKFAQAILDVKSGKFDLTPGLYMTRERAESVDFVPYFSAGTAILAPEDGPEPARAEDLCGTTVSSIKGGAVVAKVRDELSPACVDAGQEPVNVREYPSDPEATQALISGGVDFQLTETIIAQEALERTSSGLKITNEEPLFPVQVGWGIAKGNEALQKALSEALADVTESGAYELLLNEYGLSPHDPELAAEAIQ